MKLSDDVIKQRVFNNSLETCEYISGYNNVQSEITVRCIVHNLIFKTKYENVRRDNRKHHICPQCQRDDIDNKSTKMECECAYCHIKFMRVPSKLNKSKSGLYFCCREHKDLAQQIESGEDFAIIRPVHYGQGQSNYRIQALRKYPHRCAICEWEEDVDVLEVHHINENRDNNDIDNLIVLCPTCHKKLTTHKYKLIDRNKIVLVSPSG